MMSSERLKKQIEFLAEIDKLKKVRRQTLLLDRSRTENDAEHSWHLAMLVLVLQEYADQPIEPLRVLKMVLIHDLVEIDAGDAFIYDQAAQRDKVLKERTAADRIFNLLPSDQAEEMRALWDEFEAGQSADARFAAALDRFQPILFNCLTEGVQWKKHGVQQHQVLSRCDVVANGSRALWADLQVRLEKAVASGHLTLQEE